MKLIIAGSRNYPPEVADALVMNFMAGWQPGPSTATPPRPTQVVCGGARGIDRAGKRWARQRGIPVVVFEPDWEAHGRAAGPIRNAEMAAYGDGLVLIWNGYSPGSADMKRQALRAGLPLYEWVVDADHLAYLARLARVTPQERG